MYNQSFVLIENMEKRSPKTKTSNIKGLNVLQLF